MNKKFTVTGMTCSACSAAVEREVKKVQGVNNVSVNLLTNSMTVDFEDNLSEDTIVNAVCKAGYGVENTDKKTASSAKSTDTQNKEDISYKKRLIISFGFLIPLMYVSMGHMVNLPLPEFLSGTQNAVSFAFIQFLLCIPVVLANQKYFTKGFGALWHKNPNMDSLIAVGSGASLVYGIFAIFRMSYALGAGDTATVHRYHMDLYFEGAAMILALISVGKYLEARSKGKTGDALKKLLDLAPKTAFTERDGKIIEISADDLSVGDIMVIKPGCAVPADGVIIEGDSYFDQAAITGESIPVHKKIGDSVISATINKNGFVKAKATKVGKDTIFSNIIELVENASATKAPIAKLADKVAGIFVPTVMAIAVLTAAVWIILGKDFEFAFSSAVSVLVISCPCALGLATPVAIMVGTGKGAQKGILIKSGQALETAHKINTVVLDKTGTITEGKPKVSDIHIQNISRENLLSIAYGMEEKSDHPLAEAICLYAKENNISPAPVQNFEYIQGKGIKCSIDGKVYYAGSFSFINSIVKADKDTENICNKYAAEGKTNILFADENQILAAVSVADTVKKDSPKAIQDMRDMGIEVVMLTGDSQITAQGIAKNLNLNKVIAQVLPADKEKAVAALKEKGKVVAMVGDGINDAPALVTADVGIAVSNGTDIALESADIILMHNSLSDVVSAIKLSKAVIKNIKENLFWAFFYNCLGIPLAAGLFYDSFGIKLNPMFAAAAMSCSSLFVVGNALRLRYFGDDKKQTEKKEINKMTVLKVNGMMCNHCKKHVEDALNAIAGVNAQVNLEKKEVTVTHPENVTVEMLAKAVTDAGYEFAGTAE